MTVDEIKKELKNTLTEEKYLHSLGVSEECGRLAERYGLDKERCALAGLVHDCAKCLSGDEIKELGFSFDQERKNDPFGGLNRRVVHSFTGRLLAEKKYGICDEEVLDAVLSHVTGRPGMSMMGCIVFIADYTEKNREGEPFVSIRETLENEGIFHAMKVACDSTVRLVLERNEEMDLNTMTTRNWVVQKLAEGEK